MSLLCLLSITACIHTQDVLIPSEDAISLLDDCQVIRRLAFSDFEEPQGKVALSPPLGSAYIEILSDRGLPIKPTFTPADRRASAISACNALDRDFNNDEMWEAPQQRELLLVTIFGAILEALGAATIGVAAYQNRRRTKRTGPNLAINQEILDNSILDLRKSVRRGVILTGAGLLLQLFVMAGF